MSDRKILKFPHCDESPNESLIGLALQNEGVGNQCGYVRPSLKYHKKQNEPN